MYVLYFTIDFDSTITKYVYFRYCVEIRLKKGPVEGSKCNELPIYDLLRI